ncbi:MAG TPA: flagellar FlbD family protein [Candidatus Acidoferrum sp.]|jgi:flagellar protein FlbD
MIHLTRLNNHPLVVNSDLIKFVENAPDTVLTLVTGEKIVVLESSEQVLQRIVEFRRTILSDRITRPADSATAEPAAHLPPGTENQSD